MGLLDVLHGMQNGPHGSKTSEDTSSGGGMSPITMAILALLAYKAVKHVAGSAGTTSTPAGRQSLPPATPTPSAPSNNTVTADAGGGLGSLLPGGLGGTLGGLLAGGAAGSVLSGGLNDLLKQLQDAGHGDTANSWVGNADNKQISPHDLGSALGSDQINTLTEQTGLSRNELLEGLARQLPEVINQLTPNGRVPTEHEASRWL